MLTEHSAVSAVFKGGIVSYANEMKASCLGVNEVTLADGSLAYASDGAPSDCVALATLGYFKKKVDLVVSGTDGLGHLAEFFERLQRTHADRMAELGLA